MQYSTFLSQFLGNPVLFFDLIAFKNEEKEKIKRSTAAVAAAVTTTRRDGGGRLPGNLKVWD